MALRMLAALVVILVTAACRLPGTSTACPQIDWVDFIQIGATQYVAGIDGGPATVDPSELGPVVMTVKFKVDGNVCDPSYKVKDGDAAFLDVGTPVYSLITAGPVAAVAARREGVLVRYSVFKPAS